MTGRTYPRPSTIGHLYALTSRLPDGAGLVLSGAGSTRDGGRFLARCSDELVTADTVPAAADLCRRRSDSLDLYASVTATDVDTFAEVLAKPGRKRGGEAHARWLYCLWADLDIAGPGHANSDQLPTTVAEAERIYADLPTPTLVVNSAGGLHLWWLLAEPVDIAADLEGAKRLATGWQQLVNAHAARYGYRSDNVDDLARVLRVCGTTNHKTDTPRPVTLHDVGTWPDVGLWDGQGWPAGPLHDVDRLAELVDAYLAELEEQERARVQMDTPADPRVSDPRVTRPAVDAEGWQSYRGSSTLNILEAVDAASWSDIWPANWAHVGHENIEGVAVELWRRPDASSAYSAKCWPDGACKVWSDSVPGLEAGAYSKAAVLAWRMGVDLSRLAREIIRAGRALA